MPNSNLVDAFKSIYFHLYSNGQASRAERIVEDLTLVLLAKLAVERLGQPQHLRAVLEGGDPRHLLGVVRKEFPQAVRSDDQFSNDHAAIRHALAALADVQLTGTPAHVVGDAFQSLVGPRVRGDKGQFFTPRSLVRSMVQIVSPRPGESVLDPAAGTGGFLAEAYAFRSRGSGSLIGVDKDFDLHRLATALLGITAGADARLHNFNSLDLGQWSSEYGRDSDLFDVVLTNPPFGAKIGITDDEILASYDFGHQWTQSGNAWVRSDRIAASRDPQILFIELCVRLLKPNGRMAIVLPEGVFGNRGVGFVWQWLQQRGHISALLDCPRVTFLPGTDTKTNVLFFTKGAPAGPTRIAVALTAGHDRRGRTHRSDGSPHENDFERLASTFGSWKAVDLREHAYLVPRYHEEQPPASAVEEALLAGAQWASLGELVAQGILEIRKGHEPGSDAYGTGDVPFVRTSDISNFEVTTDPTKSVSEAVFEKYRGLQRLTPGDILMVVDGRYRIGASAMLSEASAKAVVQSHIRIMTVDPAAHDVDAFSLLFALSLASVRRRIRDLVFVQSTLGTLGDRLNELRIPLLGADGQWRDSVERFRQTLVQREILLRELVSRGADSIEL